MSQPQQRYHDFMHIEQAPNNELLSAAKRQAQAMHTSRLRLSTLCEMQNLSYNETHKCWAMLTLQTDPVGKRPKRNNFVDFVVCIDLSASMKTQSKLAFVQASIEYLLDRLDERHRFSLVIFNHVVQQVTDLISCTQHNKEVIKRHLRGLTPNGSTNISGALFKAIEILNRRGDTSGRIASVMLFTDGLSNRGPTAGDTLAKLDKLQLPRGCIVNTFGYGRDHDSRMLHGIAMRSKGIYYYVETQDAIAATFGECVAGILSTEAHQIVVSMRGQDGGRIVTLANPYPVIERRVAKDYDINLGLMYSGESKSLLFKMSLRKLRQPQPLHVLALVTVKYVSTLTGRREIVQGAIQVRRPNICPAEPIPLHLDQQINRYATAVTIQKAIGLAEKNNCAEGLNILRDFSQRIRKSASADQPYCEDLLKDLEDVMKSMTNKQNFSGGIHMAYSLCAMYYMERSTGSRVLSKRDAQRHAGYGYVTVHQALEARNAMASARSYVTGYALKQGSLRHDPMDTN